MKGIIVFVGIMLMAAVASADTFQWSDSQGVHFTDDIDKVPAKYRNKAQKVDVTPVIQQEQTEEQAPAAKTHGGQGEEWWRSRFRALRDEMKSIQDKLPEKKEKFASRHRRYVIFSKPSDRVAENDLDNDIKNDEARIEDIRRQLADLDVEASKAGVPMEWRQ